MDRAKSVAVQVPLESGGGAPPQQFLCSACKIAVCANSFSVISRRTDRKNRFQSCFSGVAEEFRCGILRNCLKNSLFAGNSRQRRRSTMQIYSVRILNKPASGELVMVGTSFRYFAKPDFSGTDKFSLMVVGKNLREEGYSTVEITVSRRDAPLTLSAASP